jgi:Icc-related predicted phosphoesterase
VLVPKQDADTLEDVDHWFAEIPAKTVICIGGNHDFLLQSREFRFAHAVFLQDRVTEIQTLSVYGSAWCPDLSGFAFYAAEEELIEHWRKIPSKLDILVTHTPPHGILDLPTSGVSHLGCSHLRAELKRVRPRYHFFGHVHASHGATTQDGTYFVNAAVVGGRDFDVRHGPTLIGI